MTYQRLTLHTRSSLRHGFTMAEMLVAVTIMVIVTAVVAGLFVQVRKVIGIAQWSAETRSQLRTTVDLLSHDLQNLDDQAYFLMLNRDYGTYDPVSGNALGPQVYPGSPDVAPAAKKRLWADRIAFVVKGPLNVLQDFKIAGKPPIAPAGRVYYGHSLWTHDMLDATWLTQPGVVLNNTDLSAPLITPPWTGNFANRPAVNWDLVRQAVLQVEHVDANPATDPTLCVNSGGTVTLNDRLNNDYEFNLLHGTLGVFSHAELARWIDLRLASSQVDWAALLWAPRIRQFPTSAALDPRLAVSRVLLPHATRVRFQLRLSDGTIVPQTYENSTDDRRWLQGALIAVANNAAVGTSPSYRIDAAVIPGGNSPLEAISNIDVLPVQPAGSVAGTDPEVPMMQMAYIWTNNNTNIQPKTLHPVALRVSIEVYDPERRTPDPIRVDEWLPIRWER